MTRMLHFARTAVSALGIAILAGAANAQTWPTKPVRIIVPFGAGGTSDTLGRVVAEQLGETFKQQFIVENRPGAGGLTGSALVARAPPDGYTLLVSGVASHVVVPAINPSASYDPVKGFTHIALFGGPPSAFVVNPSVKAATLKEFEAVARASATPISYGSPGAGTHGHLMGEAYAQRAGLKLEHIAYKGGAPAMTDLIAGHIPASSNALTSAAPHIRSGAARPLALTSPTRLKAYPDVPTFAESGYPDLVATTWFGLSGPAGMPADIVDRLNKEVIRILALPQVRERLERDAVVTEPLTPAQFAAYVVSEMQKWGPVAKNAGAQPE